MSTSAAIVKHTGLGDPIVDQVNQIQAAWMNLVRIVDSMAVANPNDLMLGQLEQAISQLGTAIPALQQAVQQGCPPPSIRLPTVPVTPPAEVVVAPSSPATVGVSPTVAAFAGVGGFLVGGLAGWMGRGATLRR